MFNIISGLLGKMFSEKGALIIPLVLLVLTLVIPNIGTITKSLGIETKSSLYSKITKLEKRETELSAAVKLLELENEKLREEIKLNDRVLREYLEETKNIDNKVNDIESKRKQDIKVLDKVEVVNTTTSNSREDMISEINISSIHQVYDTVFGDSI